jgi:hypothetical protein
MTKVGATRFSAAETKDPSDTAKPMRFAGTELFHVTVPDHGVALTAATSFLLEDWEVLMNCRVVCVRVSRDPPDGVV